ncbi:hypothetical protein H6P81_014565 [Aristolochia fimbriata]|uniref:Uncharacterized protein n=1 Tax=Aristolochia fimbriata TaxID=158543 RepID=A0AAV7E2U2_ARIFI|nr:hypothetical protein H6P81_014565 [Aristolochia fimbriata]
MAHLAEIFLVLVALLFCSGSLAQDFTYLNLKWPGGICSGRNKCCFPCTMSDPNDFKIDFLARNFRSGSPSCNTEIFRVNSIQSYMEGLYQNWPGMKCPAETGVLAWETAWDDNGVCTGLTQYNYFLKTLTLFKSARLLEILSAKGIAPSKYWTYKQSEVVNAINEGLGARTALIHCGSNSSAIIRTVRLCADIAASRLTFGQGTTFPSNEDLIAIFDKFGELNKSETAVLGDLGCARVVFLRSSDAEKAFNSSDKISALRTVVVSYRLRYLSAPPKASEVETPVAQTHAKASMSEDGKCGTPEGLRSQTDPTLMVIKKNLESMMSTLSHSGEGDMGSQETLSPEVRENLMGEIKGLLKKTGKLKAFPSTPSVDDIYISPSIPFRPDTLILHLVSKNSVKLCLVAVGVIHQRTT